MREVIEKQETLQRKFVEVLDKCEKDRMAREEAWKKEELERIKKERELLAHERSIAAAKDEAVLAFLKKFAEAEGTVQLLEKIQVQNDKQKNKHQNGANANRGGDVTVVTDMDKQECGNNGVSVGNFVHMSSSRWPKDEVEALIRLRTEFDVQAQGNNNNSNNGSKGPLWEEISLAMKSIGYDRSAKRCKEKWENINKYFKRIKEKSKRKPQDSKTCPYYHHLEALYSKKPKKVDHGNELKPEELLMHIMVSQSQEQQQQQEMQTQTQSPSEDAERDQNQGDNEDQSEYQNQMVDNNSPSIAIMS